MWSQMVLNVVVSIVCTPYIHL